RRQGGRRHVPGERPDLRAATGRRSGARARPRAQPRRAAREEVGAGGRRGLLARTRLRRDRRNHLVHEHVEPVGDDRRGTAGEEGELVVCAVLSGNRNFEARIHGEVKANYLASPPLVVAYALAGRMDIDMLNEPLGEGDDGPVFLRDLWPTAAEIDQTITSSVDGAMYTSSYGDV